MEEKRVLTKADFFSLRLKQEEFDCTRYGLPGVIVIRELSVDERDQLELSVIVNGEVSLENLRAKTLALSCVDENGNKVFAFEDAKRLGQMSGRMMVDMYRVAKRLSALGEDEVKALVKKSGPGEGDGSSSD